MRRCRLHHEVRLSARAEQPQGGFAAKTAVRSCPRPAAQASKTRALHEPCRIGREGELHHRLSSANAAALLASRIKKVAVVGPP
jgi:hypothetical protein